MNICNIAYAFIWFAALLIQGSDKIDHELEQKIFGITVVKAEKRLKTSYTTPHKISPPFIDEQGIFCAKLVNIDDEEINEEELIDHIKNLSIEEKRELVKKGLWRNPKDLILPNKPDTPDKIRKWLHTSTDDERNNLIKEFDLPLVDEK